MLGNMGIDLCGGKITMPQQHLHHPQIGTMIQQVRSKGVAQNMGRQGLLDPCS